MTATVPSLSLRHDLIRFRADPIAFLLQVAKADQPLCEFRLARRRMALVTKPQIIEEILVQRQKEFKKGPGFLRSRPLLGDGLLTVEDARHQARRRSLQPAFNASQLASYRPEITKMALEGADGWRDGITRDVFQAMARLTLEIVQRTLFGAEICLDSGSVADNATQALHGLYGALSQCPHLDPDPGLAIAKLSDAVEELITNAESSSGGIGLICLMRKSGIDQTDLRHEAMTFLLAGHESVATALTWTLYAISKNPKIRALFEAEVDSSDYDANDPAHFPYTKQIIKESLRLYPPSWMLSREALEEIDLGGKTWHAGTIFVLAPSVTHTDIRFWDDPFLFNPSRWDVEAQTLCNRPRFAYFPFGGGARRCIGESFALAEMTLILAAIGRKWRLDVPVGAPPPQWEPLITSRPSGGLQMVFTAR